MIDVRLRGWAYSEPLNRGLVRGGGAAAQAECVAYCVVHLHSLGREHNLGLKSFNYYPLLVPSHLSAAKPVDPHCL